MNRTGYAYLPDYCVPPGWVLEEILESKNMKPAELARRCGCSRTHIHKVLNAKVAVEPETAIQFERVLGVKAIIWTNLESAYRLHLAKEKEREKFIRNVQWAQRFPVKFLISTGVLSKSIKPADTVIELLTFFGVGSVDAWERQFGSLNVAMRQSQVFQSNREAVLCWLRLGELQAMEATCASFDSDAFKKTLHNIRSLTNEAGEVFAVRLRELCSAAGVLVVYVPPLPGMSLSGAARWLSSDKALIQLSLRHKTNDHFWFTFFHEAGHLLLNKKRMVFVDEEKDADNFAKDFLIPPNDWAEFVKNNRFSEEAIVGFANMQGIAPGIIVGRLQHEKLISYRWHNHLKEKLDWEKISVDSSPPGCID